MIRPRSTLGALVASSLVLLGASPAIADLSPGAAASHRHPASEAARTSKRDRAMAALDEQSVTRTTSSIPHGPGQFVGSDGLAYPLAPQVVYGQDGDLFLGDDFDSACEDGNNFNKGLQRLAELANMIEQSGRRVVFTVVPNKSEVDRENLTSAEIPHGVCAEQGIKHQKYVLEHYSNPDFVPLLQRFVDSKTQTYWRTDAHWTTVGASEWAYQLAKKLSPALAADQRYKNTTRVELGDLMQYLLTPLPESAPARLPHNGVKVRKARGSDGFSPIGAVTFDHRWLATPASKTWPGRTLLIGDSFTYLGLEPLRNLFHVGRFLWTTPETLPDIATSIKDAHTVVIEVVQRFVDHSLLGRRAFRRQVSELLGEGNRVTPPAG